MRSKFLFLCMIVGLSGCGVVNTLTDGFKHSQEVAADLEKSVGSKPFVGFNWNNGSLTNVSINFEGIPTGKSTQEIVELSQKSISEHFKQSPKQVVVSFSVPGG